MYGAYVQYYVQNNIWLPATGLSCVIDFSKHDVNDVVRNTYSN